MLTIKEIEYMIKEVESADGCIGDGLNIRFGLSESGRLTPIRLNNKEPHVLIEGLAGSGKTNLINVIEYFLIKEYGRGVLINHLNDTVAHSQEDQSKRLAVATHNLMKLVEYKERLLKENNCTSFMDLLKVNPRVSHRDVFIFDTVYEYQLSEIPRTYEKLLDIVSRADKLGIHIIFATQKFNLGLMQEIDEKIRLKLKANRNKCIYNDENGKETEYKVPYTGIVRTDFHRDFDKLD